MRPLAALHIHPRIWGQDRSENRRFPRRLMPQFRNGLRCGQMSASADRQVLVRFQRNCRQIRIIQRCHTGISREYPVFFVFVPFLLSGRYFVLRRNRQLALVQTSVWYGVRIRDWTICQHQNLSGTVEKCGRKRRRKFITLEKKKKCGSVRAICREKAHWR